MDNLTLYNYITEAQEALVKYWGEDGKKIIAQCFQERAFGGDITAFLKFCTAHGGNWGGMFLSGIDYLYPEVYALIPNEMGQSAFACIMYTMLLLGVKTWESNKEENQMKSITLTYPTYKTATINVTKLPERYKRWLEAVFTDEDDRSDAQWDLAEEHNYYPEIIRLATGDTVDPYEDIDVEDYRE